DFHVTGVQTCALPISIRSGRSITMQQLEALREAAQAENFKETLKAAGVANEHLDEVARLLREERNLGRLAEGLEATRFIKVGEEIGRASCREREEGEG